MLSVRVIPCLQLINSSLVKTVQFNRYNYIGDPVNTVRIFNELEVDELCFLDIRTTLERKGPDYKILSEISDECFMPLSYGGGITSMESAGKILSIGFEKVVINTAALENPEMIKDLSECFGSQSIIISIDVKRNLLGKYEMFSHDGTKKSHKDPVEWAVEAESYGAGELLVTSIDRDGTWTGYDVKLTRIISDAVRIPVIANGGCGKPEHINEVVRNGKASAAALGSMVVYQAKGMGVLVNFPEKNKLVRMLEDH